MLGGKGSGTEMTTIYMEVKTTMEKGGNSVVVTRKAEITADKLSFETLGRFMDDIHKVNAQLKSAIKKNLYTEFDICNYVSDANCNITAYDRWFYKGWAGDEICDQGNGVLAFYLQPDTRYTPANHDMVYDFTLESITDGSLAWNRESKRAAG